MFSSFLIFSFPFMSILQLRLNKLIMYNLFQYTNICRERKHLNLIQQQQADFCARHQQFKNSSYCKLQQRAEDFLLAQKGSNQSSFFLGNSSLKLKKSPSLINTTRSKFIDSDQVDGQFANNRRNIKNRAYSLSKKSTQLTQFNTKFLPNASNSFTKQAQHSQHKKVSIKAYNKNYSIIESRKPITQFDHNFNKLYKNFQNSQSKLYKCRKSILGKYENRLYNETRKYIEESPKRESRIQKFSVNPQELEQTMGNNSYNIQKSKEKRQGKVYFKLAKTMQMFHPQARMRQQFQNLLKKSNYSVEKKVQRYSNSFCK